MGRLYINSHVYFFLYPTVSYIPTVCSRTYKRKKLTSGMWDLEREWLAVKGVTQIAIVTDSPFLLALISVCHSC